jgi:haloacetate dehalogenase
MDLPDLFPGFDARTIDAGESKLFVRIGGAEASPPLVLLHGFPETHVMWAAIAGELARHFRVVVPDLPGYGWSRIPEQQADSAQMSKRAMAGDIVALMEDLGAARFAVVGHDRGARVSYRLALDNPGRVTRLAVLDIIPTLATWQAADAAFAMRTYHWFFLAQPRPMPERLIAKDAVAYLDHTLASWTKAKSLEAFGAGQLAHYRAAFSVPERVAATCEDYRAGWQVDRLHDEADLAAGRKIDAPMLVLWGNAGLPADAAGPETTPLQIWQAWANHVEGTAIDSGHFLVEENPAATLAQLLPFLLAGV